MESALCHRHGHLPGLTLRIPNFPVNGASRVITRPHLSFSPTSLSLSNTNLCIYRRLGHAFSPIVCAMNRNPTPWRNDESDNKVVRAGTVGAASLMLACALGIISCSCMKSPKAMAICNNQKKREVVCISRAIYPEGGEALKYLSDMISVYSSQKKPAANFKLKGDKKISREQAAVLKKEAMWMVKSGKDNDAVRLLKNTLTECVGEESKFYVEMALVEVLICLGRWEEALQYNCICGQSENKIADFRVPLYSALINTMLDNKDSAQKCWEEFTVAVGSEGPPS
ncbi:hypothetical protein F2P56_006979 [Juglans regia]|uniref:Protein SLOW GREEN 1, chloroplastic-like n=2 Tax=Juglans regia TaxID=51240 RepID=A0A833Y4S7_JUGRE|nr:uncharacterized protein LOC108988617 [Juglans regia]KAF5475140.1 hypothetical protein F2P56_006979 [Juglans regia]